jgi:hypothetical protein
MMGEAAYSARQEPDQSVEIVVHVDESLPEIKRADMINALENIDGIISAEFCPLRYHLMLVRYDREALNSQDVLGKVNNLDVHAVLIGPV